MEKVYQLVGQIFAYTGGTAVIAYLIIRFLGKKIIEQIFSEKLERFKKIQEQELERFKKIQEQELENYRYHINSLFSRISKIHEKEIEILPELWKLLLNAITEVKKTTSIIQSTPNLDNMTSKAYKEFISLLPFTESQKIQLNKSQNRDDEYKNIIFWYDLEAAKKNFSKFHEYFQMNRIFLTNDLKNEFSKIDILLLDSLAKREVQERSENKDWGKIGENYMYVAEETEKVLSQIEKIVQRRLEFSKAEPVEL